MSKVQEVIQQAQHLFSQNSSPQHIIDVLGKLLDQINAQDLNLDELMANLNPECEWDSEPIFSTPDFSLQLFMIKKGSKIPLHDHPHMWVLMRVLYGTLHLRTFNWAEEYPLSGLARKCCDETANGATSTILVEPNNNNVHEIYAIDDCAFLDLLFPPYDHEERACHYYKEEQVNVNGETLTKLERLD
ncbi:hypothetical protein [Candidatus Uabimicrobium amorphum]|uniref:Cysteine dioxygenase n=1 Tax=Uabimicrobium amorphum TaxID=2596890 RepID=A0A5S9F4U9_UABAM|nr:hypothetical protein [Candidatus Uabimicrobium amorphum]BBM84612.1 hypothetical protein UABAM_02973 [Candidatus Uabimicrobium amorphum]